MTPGAQLQTHLGAERLACLIARHNAVLSGSTQQIHRATEDLKRATTAVLAAGPSPQQEDENA